MQRKPFKFYTHHFTAIKTAHESVKRTRKISTFAFKFFYNLGVFVLWSGKSLGRGLFFACYGVGTAIVNFSLKILSIAKKDVEKTAYYFKHRLKNLQAVQFRQSLGMFLLVCLLGWGVFVGAKVVANALELKSVVEKFALSGNDHLTQAQKALTAQNFAQADSEFAAALSNFNATSKEIHSTGDLLNGLLNVFPQKRDAEKLVMAGTFISKAGQQMVSVSDTLGHFKISPEGISSSNNFEADMDHLSKTLSDVSATMTEVQSLLQDVDPNILPKDQALKLVTAKGKIQFLNSSLKSLGGLFAMLKDMTTGQKNVLVLFENNNELRATGGFLGTYGNFTLDNGKIKNLKISSIYDLDGQLKEDIVPPTPLLNVNNRWFLRDSNWFANFPDSAKKISGFYEKEGGETPDLVITLTPQLISDWLKITGPIEMKNFNVTFDSDNFVERMQAESSIDYNSPLNNPKQIMADFFPVLLQKLSTLTPEQYPLVAQSLLSNLVSKQILLYSRDANLQSKFSLYNWGGEILPTDRDSLSVVSSNLGGTKTDLSIDQKIELSTTIDKDGNIVNGLTVTRSNKLPKMDGTDNSSFIRIFVPKGSELISNTGFDYKNLDTSVLKNYKTDSEVHEWEKAAVRDIVTGTLIGQEAGKTYFGNWLTVAGGETKTIKLVYKLPFKLQSLDHYSLLLQKQPGTLDQQFNQTIHFSGKKLEWKNFTESSMDAGSVQVAMPLSKDYLLGSIFSNR